MNKSFETLARSKGNTFITTNNAKRLDLMNDSYRCL